MIVIPFTHTDNINYELIITFPSPFSYISIVGGNPIGTLRILPFITVYPQSFGINAPPYLAPVQEISANAFLGNKSITSIDASNSNLQIIHEEAFLNCFNLINVDLTNKNLPFPSKFFEVIVSQHVIEHLDLKNELEPLFKELHRVLNSKGSLFLSCPSIKKICESYIKDGCKTLVDGRKRRFPSWSLDGYPNVQIINELFHQGTEHKNLFDFELLSFSLCKCGFTKVEEIDEKIFLRKYKSFPKRFDDEQTLYIVAYK